jgi:hypothetical protein
LRRASIAFASLISSPAATSIRLTWAMMFARTVARRSTGIVTLA